MACYLKMHGTHFQNVMVENKLTSVLEDENNLVPKYSEPGNYLHSFHHTSKSGKHYSSIRHSFCQSSQSWANSFFPVYASFLHIGKCEVDILIHLLQDKISGDMLIPTKRLYSAQSAVAVMDLIEH